MKRFIISLVAVLMVMTVIPSITYAYVSGIYVQKIDPPWSWKNDNGTKYVSGYAATGQGSGSDSGSGPVRTCVQYSTNLSSWVHDSNSCLTFNYVASEHRTIHQQPNLRVCGNSFSPYGHYRTRTWVNDEVRATSQAVSFKRHPC